MPTNDHSFKIGDRVKRSPEGRAKPYCYAPSAVGVVTKVGKDWISVNNGGSSPHNYWELDSSAIDEAKALLEKEGYTVTPPKPKLTGQAVVYRYKNTGRVNAVSMETWKDWSRGTDMTTQRDILAVVNWTEGEGLEDGKS